jgi:hypothetical protein
VHWHFCRYARIGLAFVRYWCLAVPSKLSTDRMARHRNSTSRSFFSTAPLARLFFTSAIFSVIKMIEQKNFLGQDYTSAYFHIIFLYPIIFNAIIKIKEDFGNLVLF